MSARDDAAWVRVGELLQVRRVELASRYKNLALFSRERDIDYRLAWDIENHARTNFRRGTRTSIEVAYGWEPGSIERILSGGEPVARTEAPAAEPQVAPSDEWEIAVMARTELPLAVRQAAIRDHRKLVEREAEKLASLGIEPPPAFLRGGIRHLAGESPSSDEARQA